MNKYVPNVIYLYIFDHRKSHVRHAHNIYTMYMNRYVKMMCMSVCRVFRQQSLFQTCFIEGNRKKNRMSFY